MDWLAHMQTTAAHLVRMAAVPGFSDHAKQRRDELLAHPWYAGLRELIVVENRKAKDEQVRQS